MAAGRAAGHCTAGPRAPRQPGPGLSRFGCARPGRRCGPRSHLVTVHVTGDTVTAAPGLLDNCAL
eukprot:310868-Hanusia_phi.AAC.1